MKLKNLFSAVLLAIVGMTSNLYSQVTLSSDFTNPTDERAPLYKFWAVRNEIPAYPGIGSQKPPNLHTSNCIRLLGGWSTNGVINEAEDSCIWDESQQKYVYRLSKIINRIDGVLTDGFMIHQLVLDNPPWCFQRGLTFSANPGPGEYQEANRVSTYGNSMPPGEPAAWNDYIRAVMSRLIETYGRSEVEKWRFRIGTESDYFPHHWSGTKMDYFHHYANTVDAVHAVLPGAKVAAHFLQAGGNGRYGAEFVTWCGQNNVPCDFIGVTYYPFYNNSNHVNMDRLYDLDLKPFVDSPGWKPHMRLEIPEYSLFTEKDDDGFNMGVGTSHNPAFVAMFAKTLYEKSIVNVHNWGEHASDPVFLALDGMLGKRRYSNQKTGSPANSNNKIDGILAIGADRTSVDALVHNYHTNPAYLATESVNLSVKVPVPAGTPYIYRIASCDQSNNPHDQFVKKYPLAGMWQSEGGWVLDRIKPDSVNQTDKNGLLDQILVDPGKTLWNQEKSTFTGYQSLVWSEWTTLTTSNGNATGSFLNLSIPSPSFSFQKIEFRTSAIPIPENVDAPVAHWPLDEGGGTMAHTTESTYTGTLLNGAGWGSDAVRTSYVAFDGTDDRISTSFTYALSAGHDFSWAWWANKQSANGTGGGSIMVGNRYPERISPKYGFIKMTPDEAQFANTGTTSGIDKYNHADLPQGGWHHYAMVKTGTSCQWYVDGVPQGPPVVIGYDESSFIPFLIGGDDDGSGTKVNEHFQGFIDDVVLYRRALTSNDVVSVMNGIYLPHTPPTISTITDQTILANTSTGSLVFTLGDDLTQPDSITLSKNSSNTDLVPLANIVFGGSGDKRSVTVTPQPDQSGSAVISLVANDGTLSSILTFTLTVMPQGAVRSNMVYAAAGTTTWVCPSGVTKLQVECWGGGGAGGGGDRTTTSGGAAGGGGAAGSYALRMNVPVTPGNSYSITIPEAATCPTSFSDGQRFNGSSVGFSGDGGVTVTARGGEGGACHIGNAVGAGGTGSIVGCVGDLFHAGGGGALYLSNNGCAGGGAPSDLAAGGHAVDGTAGSGATGSDADHQGGSGGGGRAGQNTGFSGGSPGGGGGGGKSQTQNVSFAGGTGGVGRILLTYFRVANTAQEDWRMQHFGTTDNTGDAADSNDADSDGEMNLLEFATGQDPHANTLVETWVAVNGANLEFHYLRSKAATGDGIQFTVQWGESLSPDTWSSLGVTEITDPENDENSSMEKRIATIPSGTSGKCFVRLMVSRP